MQARIRHQHAGEQAGFSENLEAVANTQHIAAALRMGFDLAHDGRTGGHRPAAQVIAVRESTGQHHHIHFGQFGIGVPDAEEPRP